MLNKFKFIPLILISLFTLSFAVQISLSSSSYDYRFRISAAGDMWLYDGIVDGISEHCQYTRIENNAYAQPNFNETAFKKDSFYAQSDPTSKSPDGYFDDPATLYKFLGSETYEGSVSFKHETYSWAKKPNSIQKICVQCNTKAGEYFDSTTGLCVNKCEDITNQNDRLDCMCKRAGKIGYNGSFSTMNIGGDGSMVCSYGCKSTKDDPEARPNGDGTMFNVSYDIKDTDPNANGVCFTDDIYAPNATPGPSPKPDKPDNNNTKPGGGSKPDKPDQGGGGHPGGGSNPGNNNGTKPGNDNGTKPGKDDNQGKFDPKDFDDGGLDKARDGLYDSIKNHLENGISKFDGVRDGIDQFISNVKGKGFAKVKSDIKRSCPIKKEIQLPDGKARELVVDYCDAVAPASEVSYYVFYVFFIVGIFLLLLKLFVVLI